MKLQLSSILAALLATGMAAQAQDVVTYTTKAAKATGHAIAIVGKTTGHGTETVVKKTGSGTQTAAKKTAVGVKKGVTGTAHQLKG